VCDRAANTSVLFFFQSGNPTGVAQFGVLAHDAIVGFNSSARPRPPQATSAELDDLVVINKRLAGAFSQAARFSPRSRKDHHPDNHFQVRRPSTLITGCRYIRQTDNTDR